MKIRSNLHFPKNNSEEYATTRLSSCDNTHVKKFTRSKLTQIISNEVPNIMINKAWEILNRII